MRELINATTIMATVINNPNGNGSGMGIGMMLGIVLVIIILGFLFIMYGLPAFQGAPEPAAGASVNITLPEGDGGANQ